MIIGIERRKEIMDIECNYNHFHRECFGRLDEGSIFCIWLVERAYHYLKLKGEYQKEDGVMANCLILETNELVRIEKLEEVYMLEGKIILEPFHYDYEKE